MVVKSKNPLRAATDAAQADGDRKLAELERRGVAAGLPRTFFSKIRQERFTSQMATATRSNLPDAVNGVQERTADLGDMPVRTMKPGESARDLVAGRVKLTPEQEESDASIAREMTRLEGLNLATCQQIVAKGRNSVPGQKAGQQLTPTERDMLARAKASIRGRDGR